MLLVEDEPFVREATKCILQSGGFQVLPAADGLEAIQIFRQHASRVDMMMSDLVLPGWSGLRLRDELRCLSPMLPILLTSGYLETGGELEDRDSLTYYLPKPYSRTDLLVKLEQVWNDEPRWRAASQAG